MTHSAAAGGMPGTNSLDVLLEENARARADLLTALDAVPASCRTERWYGEWSLRDIVAHLAVWQEGCAVALEALAHGEPPRIPGFDEAAGGEAVNAARAAEHRDDSWEQVMHLLRGARQRHEAAVRALAGAVEPASYAEGRTAHRLAVMPGGHDRSHAGPILEWRREQGL